ncbi:MAG: tetratricopeptide repeat protein [Nanoarchaeota archaeon]|nr:tetratricopeptide repeat protein [Nanoarchaeota archaeon]
MREKKRWKPVGKVVFRIILVLVLLEIGLRIGGGIRLAIQSGMNELPEDNHYRILVLGDSNTYLGGELSWPRQLEGILNNESSAIRFKIINRAYPGATSSEIVEKLESNLDTYEPLMVVVMMGISDHGMHVKLEDTTSIMRYLQRLKIYGLVEFLLSDRDEPPATNQSEHDLVEMNFLNAIRQDPDNYDNYINLGSIYFLQKRYYETEEIYLKAIEIQPNVTKAYLDLWWVHLAGEKYDDADAITDKLEGLDELYHAYNYLWWMHYLRGRFDKAKELSRVYLSKYGEDSGIYYHLGLLYLKESDFDNAVASFKRAVDLDPNNLDAHFGLGMLYHEKKMTKETEETFNALMQIPHERADDYILLAINLQRALRYDRAEEAFKRAVAINPYDPNALFQLSEFYMDRYRFYDQEEILKKVLELDPNHLMALARLGFHYFQAERYREAVEMGERYLELNPRDPAAYKDVALAYKSLNMTEEMIQNLEQLLAIDPDPNRIWEHAEVAVHQINIGRTDFANQILKRIYSTDPGLLERTYNQMGDIFLEQGNDKMAELIFEQAESIRGEYRDPGFEDNYLRLYDALEERGIKLVAVQYPILELSQLSRIFSDKDVILVGNEDNFKAALSSHDYDDIFQDRNYGTWGHGTEHGNRLIAESVSEKIIPAVSG